MTYASSLLVLKRLFSLHLNIFPESVVTTVDAGKFSLHVAAGRRSFSGQLTDLSLVFDARDFQI